MMFGLRDPPSSSAKKYFVHSNGASDFVFATGESKNLTTRVVLSTERSHNMKSNSLLRAVQDINRCISVALVGWCI